MSKKQLKKLEKWIKHLERALHAQQQEPPHIEHKGDAHAERAGYQPIGFTADIMPIHQREW